MFTFFNGCGIPPVTLPAGAQAQNINTATGTVQPTHNFTWFHGCGIPPVTLYGCNTGAQAQNINTATGTVQPTHNFTWFHGCGIPPATLYGCNTGAQAQNINTATGTVQPTHNFTWFHGCGIPPVTLPAGCHVGAQAQNINTATTTVPPTAPPACMANYSARPVCPVNVAPSPGTAQISAPPVCFADYTAYNVCHLGSTTHAQAQNDLGHTAYLGCVPSAPPACIGKTATIDCTAIGHTAYEGCTVVGQTGYEGCGQEGGADAQIDGPTAYQGCVSEENWVGPSEYPIHCGDANVENVGWTSYCSPHKTDYPCEITTPSPCGGAVAENVGWTSGGCYDPTSSGAECQHGITKGPCTGYANDLGPTAYEGCRRHIVGWTSYCPPPPQTGIECHHGVTQGPCTGYANADALWVWPTEAPCPGLAQNVGWTSNGCNGPGTTGIECQHGITKGPCTGYANDLGHTAYQGCEGAAADNVGVTGTYGCTAANQCYGPTGYRGCLELGSTAYQGCFRPTELIGCTGYQGCHQPAGTAATVCTQIGCGGAAEAQTINYTSFFGVC